MFDDRTSRRVGAAVLALVVLAGAAVLTASSNRLRPTIDVTVHFAHLGALEEGAHVQRAGRVIGRVEAVQLVPASRARDPRHPLHPGGGVAVRLRIQERYAGWAAPNDEFFIAVKGVLGDSYVEIGPPPGIRQSGERSGSSGTPAGVRQSGERSGSSGTPAGGAERLRDLRDGDEVRGVDPPRMDQVLVKSFYNMTEFRRLLDDVAPAARQLAAELTELGALLDAAQPSPGAYAALRGALGQVGREWARLTAGMAASGASAGDLVDLVRGAGALVGRMRAELGATGEALDRLVADIDRIRGRIPADLRDRLVASATAARAALARIEGQVALVQELVSRIRGGQGTVGALLGDPEFIDDAKKLGKILKREPWRILGHPRREALQKER